MNIDGSGQAHIRVDSVERIRRRPCFQLPSLLTEGFNNFDIAGIAEGSPSNQGSFEGLYQFWALYHVSNALSVRRPDSNYIYDSGAESQSLRGSMKCFAARTGQEARRNTVSATLPFMR